MFNLNNALFIFSGLEPGEALFFIMWLTLVWPVRK